MEREEYNKELKALITKYNNIWSSYYDDFSNIFKLREKEEQLKEEQKKYEEFMINPNIVESDELKKAKAQKEDLIKRMRDIEEKIRDINISNQEKELYLKQKNGMRYELGDLTFDIEMLEMDSMQKNMPENKQEELDEVKRDIEQEQFTNKSMGNTENDYDLRLKNALNEINEIVSNNNFSHTLTEEEKNEIIQEKAGKINEEMFEYDNKIQAFQTTINDKNYTYKENNFRKAISTLAIYERNRLNVLEGKELLEFESDKEQENIEEEKRLVFEWYENGKKYRYTERTEEDIEKAKKEQEEIAKQEAKKAKEQTKKEQEKYRVKYDKNYNNIKEIEENLERYEKEKEEHIVNVDKALKINEMANKVIDLKSTFCTTETRPIIRDMYNNLKDQAEQEGFVKNKRLLEKKMESLENTGLDLTDKKLLTEKIDENIMKKVKRGIEEIVEIESELELQNELLQEGKTIGDYFQEQDELEQQEQQLQEQKAVQEQVKTSEQQVEEKEQEGQETKAQEESSKEALDISNMDIDFLAGVMEDIEYNNRKKNEKNEIPGREDDDDLGR